MSAARPTRRAADAPEPEAARARLLLAGLRLFAQHGYAKTSTRELAEAAQVNVAAISYYFGDKAGLYRAVFVEPAGTPGDDIDRYADPALSLEDALHAFFRSMLEPLMQGDVARLCTRLHVREMLEPTGLWAADPTQGIGPMHDALLGVLQRHFGLARRDDDLQRLTTCIAGLAVHLHVARDIVDAIAPRLNEGPAAWALWAERLTMYALAMVEAERMRRTT